MGTHNRRPPMTWHLSRATFFCALASANPPDTQSTRDELIPFRALCSLFRRRRCCLFQFGTASACHSLFVCWCACVCRERSCSAGDADAGAVSLPRFFVLRSALSIIYVGNDDRMLSSVGKRVGGVPKTTEKKNVPYRDKRTPLPKEKTHSAVPAVVHREEKTKRGH